MTNCVCANLLQVTTWLHEKAVISAANAKGRRHASELVCYSQSVTYFCMNAKLTCQLVQVSTPVALLTIRMIPFW